MAQRQVELAEAYLRKLKDRSDKKRHINHEQLEKCKRRILCDPNPSKADVDILFNHRPVSPVPVESVPTPLSYDISSDGSQTIFFIGYKYPQDKYYQCEKCFVKNINYSHPVELEIVCHKNCTYGEKNYLRFKAEGYTVSDLTNWCKVCNDPLYVIRPYHSDHLDFA